MASVVSPQDILFAFARQLPALCEYPTMPAGQFCLGRIEDSLLESVLALGFDGFRYTCWTKNTHGSAGPVNTFSINYAHFPKIWEQQYDQQALYLVDPVVRVIQENMGNMQLLHGRWCDAYRYALEQPLGTTPEERAHYVGQVQAFVQAAQEQGLAAGFYYVWNDREMSLILSLYRGELAAGATDPLDTPDLLKILHAMMAMVNQGLALTRGCSHCEKSLRIEGSEPVSLSLAEQRILVLFDQHRGATISQIAGHYGRSPDTVSFHLRSIREKFRMPGASGLALAAYAADIKLI